MPKSLVNALRPVTLVVGHYGAGKTNFACNLAIDLREAGNGVTVIDLDIVNPYFRVSEQRSVLEEHGVQLIAPVFAEAGSSLDVPSLRGAISPAIELAREDHYVVIDVGGDDAGSTALGRYENVISAREYAMLYVANRFRNLVADCADAIENLHEIEAASRLRATAIVNNSHLQSETTTDAIELGFAYSLEFARSAALPLVCTTVPAAEGGIVVPNAYPIGRFVKTPWE
ncbi:MAG: ParA family protein [Eggerthellaceae bacterium]|nr:ParA family protein [Eggerthellaceae bacterium]